MVISTKGRYALRVMVELAGAEPGAYVALKDIAGRQEISEKYLEAIMKRLGTPWPPWPARAWTEAAAPAGTSAPPCPSGRGWRS